MAGIKKRKYNCADCKHHVCDVACMTKKKNMKDGWTGCTAICSVKKDPKKTHLDLHMKCDKAACEDCFEFEKVKLLPWEDEDDV